MALVTVTTLSDSVNFNDGVTSLREAIFATNLVGGTDTIDFAPSLTSGGPAALLITQGELKITDALSINGPGANLLTIDASGNDPTPNLNNGDGSRVFNIDDLNLATQFDVSISGLKLTGGDLGGGSTESGGAILTRENVAIRGSVISGNSTLFRGGGVAVMLGNLTVVDSTISGNRAAGGLGGGIYSRGTSALLRNTLTVTTSTISGNSASANGGGISLFHTNLSAAGSTINGNTASTDGGGIFTCRGNVTATASSISGNSARDGGGIHSLRGDIVVSGSTINGNAATGNGGGISSIAGNVTATNSSVRGNSATSGGGVRSNAAVTLTDSMISDNLATGNGGGIVVNVGGVLTVSGGAINANSAGGNGGGIANLGVVSVAGANISGNSATNNRGGGIWNSSGVATLTGSTVRGNSARYGGGLDSSGAGSNVTIASSQILNNSASRSGGGLYSRTVLSVSDTTISGNSAALAGGGIVSFGGNLTVAASTIHLNAAQFGGGIAGGAAGNVISVSSSTISGNSASDRAGGIFNGGGQLTLSHSTVSGNTTGNKSGGIGQYGAATLNHTIVAGNTRGASLPSDAAGNITLAFSLLGVDTGATITDNGGNLIGTAAAPIDPLLGPLADNGGPTLTHALLPGSPAINRGDLSAVAGVGGVPEFDQRGTPFGRVFGGRIDIGAFEYQAASDLNLVVDTLADESDGNYARGDLSLREAILLANTYSSTDTIRFDPALTAAGPATILLTMGELLITDDVTIEGPGASLLVIDASGNDPTPDVNNGDGSRIFNIDDGKETLSDVVLSGLSLTGGDADYGGAIISVERLTIAASTISGNHASVLGGGVASLAGGLRVENSTVAENRAADFGGGIAVFYGDLAVVSSTITGNVADTGGGIYGYNGSLSVVDSRVVENSAIGFSGIGGGISHHVGKVTVTGSTISGNEAEIGGGMYSDDETTIVRSRITGNSADQHGGGISTFGRLDVQLSTVSDNSADRNGGGIHARGHVTIDSSTIARNTAGSSGGGIWLELETVAASIVNATISNNSAHDNGGGVWTSSLGAIARIAHSTIYQNSTSGPAGAGGGVFVFSGPLALDHTIVAMNVAGGGPDLTGLLGAQIQARYSVISTNANSGLAESPFNAADANGNRIGGPIRGAMDPRLRPLANNGGPNETHAISSSLPMFSPAVDAGDPNARPGIGGVPQFDGRGQPYSRVARTLGSTPLSRIDIGAFELQRPFTSALSAGDFNQNGEVDAADYVVWRKAMGSAAAARSGGDGGGAMDAADYDVWRANFGRTVGAESAELATAKFQQGVESDVIVATALAEPVAPSKLGRTEFIATAPHPLDSSRPLPEGEVGFVALAQTSQPPALPGVRVRSTTSRPGSSQEPSRSHDAALAAWLTSRGDGREWSDLDAHVWAADGTAWGDGQNCPSHTDATDRAFEVFDVAFEPLLVPG